MGALSALGYLHCGWPIRYSSKRLIPSTFGLLESQINPPTYRSDGAFTRHVPPVRTVPSHGRVADPKGAWT